MVQAWHAAPHAVLQQTPSLEQLPFWHWLLPAQAVPTGSFALHVPAAQ